MYLTINKEKNIRDSPEFGIHIDFTIHSFISLKNAFENQSLQVFGCHFTNKFLTLSEWPKLLF